MLKLDRCKKKSHFQILANCYNTIFAQCRGFVGLPHFAIIHKWLGYQDVAVVLKELLEVIKAMVRSSSSSLRIDDVLCEASGFMCT